MNVKTFFSCTVLAATLVACGGGSSSSKPPPQEPPIKPPPVVPAEGIPTNTISHAYFRDQDSDIGKLAGAVTLITTDALSAETAPDSVWLYWADAEGNKIDNETHGAFLKTSSDALYDLSIPAGTRLPENISAFIIYPSNAKGLALEGTLIKLHDFIGNTQLSGPGGNYLYPWYYGQAPDSGTDVEGFPVTFPELRDKILVHRGADGVCKFDNGLVSIIDMNYERDIAWETGRNNGTNTQANVADDILFPIYETPCAENPIHTHRYIGDEDGAWVYSTINDAMFYGTIVYDTYVKYLGEPPIKDKLRIRLHYGSSGIPTGYWDGTYATFGDGIPLQLSASSLDSIGHEVGHGVLNRLMGVDFFQANLSKGFRTLHEAFSDISAVMAWYEYVERTGEYLGETNYWLHGEENRGRTRKLDQIVTEYGAIETMLDYDETEPDNYLSIGMITYPFYLLQQQWGIEETYGLYINAAKNCWTSTMDHTQIAQCLKQQAALISSEKEADVVAAFKTVKIKLFDEGVLSHFNFEATKLRTQFTDDSQSTSQATQWLWDFGDGQTSTEQNPHHTYATSGKYQVKLSVEDSQNHIDSLTRTVSVTDQYCRISTGLVADNEIGQVIINGSDISFSADQSDYRALLPIALIDPNNRVLNLNISGASSTAVNETIKWSVWLDINDDGFYTADESVTEVIIPAGQPYGLNTSINLSNFIAAANLEVSNVQQQVERFIRVVGEHNYNNPCSSAVGEAFDIRISW